MRNLVNNYLMGPVMGIIGKKGVDVAVESRPVFNLPFTLHQFATGNYTTRRTNFNNCFPSIRYHGSRREQY